MYFAGDNGKYGYKDAKGNIVFVNANYIPKEITASFSSFAAVTSVSIENSDDGGATWQVITFTQTSANQPTPCV